jgi:hypothetical protein
MTAGAAMVGAQQRRGVQAFASFGTTAQLQGTFFVGPRKVLAPGSSRFRHLGPSFECHYVPEIAELEKGEPFLLLGIGSYRFRREVRRGGDGFGRTIIELFEA